MRGKQCDWHQSLRLLSATSGVSNSTSAAAAAGGDFAARVHAWFWQESPRPLVLSLERPGPLVALPAPAAAQVPAGQVRRKAASPNATATAALVDR